MAVYTEKKTYHTKAHMGMIDVTEDFQHAVTEACKQHGISAGTVTGFTTGGVAGLTTLEFEPGIVNHDLKAALDVFSPYLDKKGRVVPYWHHETWHDDNGSSHIKAALLSRKVKKSISWWEPELFRSTSPGFGVADTSYKRARTAQAAAKSAAFPRKKSFKICTVRQRMSSVEWALFSIQEAAGSPQTRQEREPRPKSPREMGFPSGEKTSILNRRPSG